MTILTWGQRTNIENSLIEFLRKEISVSSLRILDENGNAKDVNVYAGRNLGNWDLPLIQIYTDSTPDANRLEIGTNKRLRSYLLIIEIRTLFPGQETNLAEWVENIINDGFTVYDYTPNSLNNLTPIKSIIGHARVDFISSSPVPQFDDADKFDKYRYRVTCKIWINK